MVPGAATDPGTRFTPLLHELEGPRLALVVDVERSEGDAGREDLQQAEVQGQLLAVDGVSSALTQGIDHSNGVGAVADGSGIGWLLEPYVVDCVTLARSVEPVDLASRLGARSGQEPRLSSAGEAVDLLTDPGIDGVARVGRAGDWAFAVEYGDAAGCTEAGLRAVSRDGAEAINFLMTPWNPPSMFAHYEDGIHICSFGIGEETRRWGGSPTCWFRPWRRSARLRACVRRRSRTTTMMASSTATLMVTITCPDLPSGHNCPVNTARSLRCSCVARSDQDRDGVDEGWRQSRPAGLIVQVRDTAGEGERGLRERVLSRRKWSGPTTGP